MPPRRSTRSRRRSTTQSPRSSRPRATATVQPSPSRTSGRRSRPEPGQRAAKLVNNVVAAVDDTSPTARSWSTRRGRPIPSRRRIRSRSVDAVETESTNVATLDRRQGEVVQTNVVDQLAAFAPKRSNLTLATPMLAQPQVAAAASPTDDVPPVVSAIGTAVFGLISFAESVFEGPPKALPGSGVTVKRSTLTIGDQESSRGLVLPGQLRPGKRDAARADHLPAARLRRQRCLLRLHRLLPRPTNEQHRRRPDADIEPLRHRRHVAWRRSDAPRRRRPFPRRQPRTAARARQAAGYKQDQLPQQVVLVGHSLGGGLVLNMARYMVAERARHRDRRATSWPGC